MNETRYDWLSDRWVIFAPNREDRPDQYRHSQSNAPDEMIECPFCSGHEQETPQSTLVLPEIDFDQTSTNRNPDSAKRLRVPWQVRVVPNKFPAISRYEPFLENDVQSRFHASPTPIVSAGAFGGTSGTQLQTAQAHYLFQSKTPTGAHEV
ncbi:MAG TPA: hypothetical protein VM260_15635, partial [Pirellula sp.]|nr:hypothetical protein [Pirellula sp.]